MKSSASSVITRAIDRWSMQRRIAGCIPPRVGGSKFAGNRTPARNSLPCATTFAQRKGHKAIANGQEELKRSHEFCGYSRRMGARCRVAPCRRAHALADARLIEACTREIRWIWKATAETQRYARPSDFLLKLFEAFEARLYKTATPREPPLINTRRECFLQVFVRDNNVDQALRVLKKKMQREGVFREMKRRRFYEKPSEKAAREGAEAIRRARKAARKKAQWEGLVAAPKRKKVLPGRIARPSFGTDRPPPRLP